MMQLWERDVPFYDRDFGQKEPSLTPYLSGGGKGDGERGAVIVLPGGGYEMKADHEGAPIARMLNEAGISAFVLDYRVSPYRHPIPLLDAQRAVRLVRSRAKEFGIRPDRIAILGFSAGGHLASTAGTHFDAGNPHAVDPVDRESCRPDAMVLCYPVVSLGEFTHEGSRNNLIGGSPTADLRNSLSNELMVGNDTPPAFIWHTADDEAVPVENSLLFAGSLSAHGIEFELHVFPHGPHGLGLAPGDPTVGKWPELCTAWLKRRGFGG
jgi:acetyl esterase/lipase